MQHIGLNPSFKILVRFKLFDSGYWRFNRGWIRGLETQEEPDSNFNPTAATEIRNQIEPRIRNICVYTKHIIVIGYIYRDNAVKKN